MHATVARDRTKTEHVAQVRCANGELGRVVAVGEKSFVARMGESDHLLRVGLGKKGGEDDGETAGDQGGEKAGGAASDFDLGYAVTGHKMQGSQAPCVIVIVDEAAGGVASQEWYYTALSRAAKLCVCVGPRAVFDRHVSNPTLIKRKTFLAEAIRESRERQEDPAHAQ